MLTSLEKMNKMIKKIAKLDSGQLQAYRDSEKNYLDFTASLETSFNEGKVEGKMEEKVEVIKNGHIAGLPIDILAKLTQLTEEQVKQILREIGLG